MRAPGVACRPEVEVSASRPRPHGLRADSCELYKYSEQLIEWENPRIRVAVAEGALRRLRLGTERLQSVSWCGHSNGAMDVACECYAPGSKREPFFATKRSPLVELSQDILHLSVLCFLGVSACCCAWCLPRPSEDKISQLPLRALLADSS